MRDYTNLIEQKSHSQSPHDPGLYVTFVLKKAGYNRLALVKAIKMATGLDLLSCKNMLDEQSMFRMTMSRDALNEFKKNLSITDAVYTLDDIQQIRRKKLVDLGIFDKSDLIEELVNKNVHDIFQAQGSVDYISELLKGIYQHIEIYKLKEVYESNS